MCPEEELCYPEEQCHQLLWNGSGLISPRLPGAIGQLPTVSPLHQFSVKKCLRDLKLELLSVFPSVFEWLCCPAAHLFWKRHSLPNFPSPGDFWVLSMGWGELVCPELAPGL